MCKLRNDFTRLEEMIKIRCPKMPENSIKHFRRELLEWIDERIEEHIREIPTDHAFGCMGFRQGEAHQFNKGIECAREAFRNLSI